MILSGNSKQPLYEQIKSQIKEQVTTGQLATGEMLPSMRGLAKSCGIGVMTVQRAYEELQQEGWIETVAGKGTFIKGPNQGQDMVKKEIPEVEAALKSVVHTGKKHGITLAELLKKLEVFYKGEA